MPFTRYKFSIIYATIKVAIMPSGNPFKFAEAVDTKWHNILPSSKTLGKCNYQGVNF